jgi:hypothetical protein
VADGVGEFAELDAVVGAGEFAELAATVGVGLTDCVDDVVHPAIDSEAITTSMIMTNNFFSIYISPLTEK